RLRDADPGVADHAVRGARLVGDGGDAADEGQYGERGEPRSTTPSGCGDLRLGPGRTRQHLARRGAGTRDEALAHAGQRVGGPDVVAPVGEASLEMVPG